MYLCTEGVSCVQKPCPGPTGIDKANEGEELEVEGDLILHLMELVSLLPSHKAAVQVAAVLTGSDEHVRMPECLLQLLDGVPRLRMLHQLRALELLEKVSNHLHTPRQQLAGFPVPSNCPCSLHDHRDEPICVHPGKLRYASHLTHAIPWHHLLSVQFAGEEDRRALRTSTQ